jgi:AraC-like DNA-binding protein
VKAREETMQLVYDSRTLPAAKRYQAWQDAICDIYLKVDCAADKSNDYEGFVRESRLGAVILTDTATSPQTVLRQRQHIAGLGKDCYYVGLARTGSVDIRQGGSSIAMHAGAGAIYCASEPYELRCKTKQRSFWVELPRQAFADHFEAQRVPLFAQFNMSRGLGRIVFELCSAVAAEGDSLDAQSRAKLGEQLMGLLALAISAEPDRQAAAEMGVQRLRLQSVKSFIDAHLSDADLSLEKIAKGNGISLRYLHQLFRLTDMSVSEWLRMRRLQRCYELLSSREHATRTITDIALSMGFCSSSHFTNLFRTQFGLRPSDVRGASVTPAPRSS